MDEFGIVAFAQECSGTPFRHQGRVKGLALDCAGLLAYSLERAGLPYLDENGYGRNPFDGMLERALDAQPSMAQVPLTDAQAGDVLLMRIKSAPQHIAIHAGLIGGHPYIIHASEQHGGVVTHRLDDMWGGRVLRAYRLRKNE